MIWNPSWRESSASRSRSMSAGVLCAFTKSDFPTEIRFAPMLFHVLFALAIVLVAARAVGLLFRRIGQPAVVGEMTAGILLGPSLFGRLAPAASSFVFGPETVAGLALLAQFGV